MKKKSLDEMLQAFSLEQHGGELMATVAPAGEENIVRLPPAGFPTGQRSSIFSIALMPGTKCQEFTPLLVVSTRQFNEKTGIVIGFPMTHAVRHQSNPFAIPVNGPKGEVGYIVANQPKSFDWKARNASPHTWGGGHTDALTQALEVFDKNVAFCSKQGILLAPTEN